MLLVASEDAKCDVTVAEFETIWHRMMPVPSASPVPGPSRTSLASRGDRGSQARLCAMDMSMLAAMDANTGAAFATAHDEEVGILFTDPRVAISFFSRKRKQRA